MLNWLSSTQVPQGNSLLTLVFWMLFTMKEYWILSHAFPASFCDNPVVCSLHFISVVCYIAFHVLNHLYIPGINPTLRWCIILLIKILLIKETAVLSASIFFGVFAFILLKDIGLHSSCGVLVSRCYQGNVGLIKWVRKLPPSLLFFGKRLRRICNPSLAFGRIHQWGHQVLSFSLFWGFW